MATLPDGVGLDASLKHIEQPTKHIPDRLVFQTDFRDGRGTGSYEAGGRNYSTE